MLCCPCENRDPFVQLIVFNEFYRRQRLALSIQQKSLSLCRRCCCSATGRAETRRRIFVRDEQIDILLILHQFVENVKSKPFNKKKNREKNIHFDFVARGNWTRLTMSIDRNYAGTVHLTSGQSQRTKKNRLFSFSFFFHTLIVYDVTRSSTWPHANVGYRLVRARRGKC